MHLQNHNLYSGLYSCFQPCDHSLGYSVVKELKNARYVAAKVESLLPTPHSPRLAPRANLGYNGPLARVRQLWE